VKHVSKNTLRIALARTEAEINNFLVFGSLFTNNKAIYKDVVPKNTLKTILGRSGAWSF